MKIYFVTLHQGNERSRTRCFTNTNEFEKLFVKLCGTFRPDLEVHYLKEHKGKYLTLICEEI